MVCMWMFVSTRKWLWRSWAADLYTSHYFCYNFYTVFQSQDYSFPLLYIFFPSSIYAYNHKTGQKRHIPYILLKQFMYSRNFFIMRKMLYLQNLRIRLNCMQLHRLLKIYFSIPFYNKKLWYIASDRDH